MVSELSWMSIVCISLLVSTDSEGLLSWQRQCGSHTVSMDESYFGNLDGDGDLWWALWRARQYGRGR